MFTLQVKKRRRHLWPEHCLMLALPRYRAVILRLSLNFQCLLWAQTSLWQTRHSDNQAPRKPLWLYTNLNSRLMAFWFHQLLSLMQNKSFWRRTVCDASPSLCVQRVHVQEKAARIRGIQRTGCFHACGIKRTGFTRVCAVRERGWGV